MQRLMTKNLTRVFSDGLARMSTTRTNYWAEFCVDMALIVLLFFEGIKLNTGGAPAVALAIVLGLLGFTFIEYFFHRWMFHTRIPLFAEGHRMHHENPRGYDSMPFFLPAVISLGLAALCWLVMPAGFAFIMTGAATLGYVTYGLSHFAIHHVRFRQPLLMRWAADHHIHHHHPECNFGVTTPLWDILLGTRYVRRQPEKA
ncbi:MAG: sterol desaturase family protein [Gammaproteobacteria bacterium]